MGRISGKRGAQAAACTIETGQALKMKIPASDKL